MYILRVSFFLFVFLSHSFVFSEPVAEVSEKAEVVFTNFVTNLLSEEGINNPEAELDKLINSGWLDHISDATENWTADEARKFLSVLQSSGVAPSSILNILLSTDYLKVLKERPAFRFSTEAVQVRSERLTAGEVFFNYVDKRLGTSEIENRMGSEWLTYVFDHTETWPASDASNLLNFLESSEVQLDSILRLLQSPDYLQKLKSGQINLDFLRSSNTVVIESTPSTHQQAELQSISANQSAGDIFVERARQYFRAEFEEQQSTKYKNMTYEEAFTKKMGKDWEDRIQKATEYWVSQKAIDLLDHLSNRIGMSLTLDRMKATSYFETIGGNYNDFIERVNFYENYIGKDEVTKRLSQSLGGFERGDTTEIERVIEFLEEYLGSQKIVQDMMLESLGGFSRLSSKDNAQTNLENIKDVIGYLKSIEITEEQIKFRIIEDFAGFVKATRRRLETKRQSLTKVETIGIAFTLDEINQMITKSIIDFLFAGLLKIKKMVAYLQSIDLEDEQIKEMAIKNLKGLAQGDPEELKSRKESLTQAETIGIAFTSAEVNQMIAESIEGVLKTDLGKVKKMVAYLQSIDFDDKQIKEMATKNFQGLGRGDPEILQSKKESLTQAETIGIAFTSDEINQMITKSLEGFLRTDLVKIKEMVVYLKEKIGFKDEQIKEMAIKNLKGLAKGNPEELKSRKESLTQAETVGIAFTSAEINQMITKSIEGFLQADLIKIKEMVVYLKEKLKFKDEQIKEMAIRNLQGLAKGNPEELKSRKESLTQAETIGIAFTSDEINKMITKSIEGFLSADLLKIKKMVAYLPSIDLDDEQIKDMTIKNFQGLATSDPEILQSKKESLTQAETIGIAFTSDEINQMITKSLEGFLQTDLEKVKKMVVYLKEEIGFKDEQIKEMAIKNFIGFSIIKSYELRDMIESFKKEPQLRKAKKEALMKKIREMITNQNLIDFYHNFDANLKALICTQALSK